ncbi:hypothetical protein [Streptomyces showdoensis]|uniref:Uncharacterized protein n=1 Tax=Streptomyces showdoensis TaxID=68268 RepID=A0A2P2GE45_STREW|nr:hypothetical protein [Streptomyces showdoensis]KKZ69787.1 hypothetical protein VO63_32290 [Streptomyces showdoensis]
MAHNPQAPYGQGGQGPEGSYDPAGSTQMFRAFVDEGAPQQQPGQRQQYQAATTHSSGPRVGVIVGVIVAIAVLAGVAWLALG